MWVATPEAHVLWGDLRELKHNVLKKGKFSANFGIGTPEDRHLNVVLRLQIKDANKRQAIADAFAKLPPFVAATRCPKCGGVAGPIKCEDCGTILAHFHRARGLRLISVGVGMLVAGIVATVYASRVTSAAGFYLVFHGLILMGAICILFGIAKMIIGRRLFLK